MRFIIGCGGTGGHIFPALAIAEQLRAMGHDLLFIGNGDGMESRILPSEGYLFSPVKVQKLYRKITPQLLTFPLHLAISTIKSIGIIKRFKAQAAFCTGGFVSGPVAAAAILTGTPLFFHESNSLPGITTKAFSRFAKTIFISFPGSRKYLRHATLCDTDVPLMKRVLAPGDFDPVELGLTSDKPIILVSGGSQGSESINKAVDASVPQILAMGFQLIWQAGKTGFQPLKQKYEDTPGVHVFDFSPRLPQYYKRASLAITRAGAMTLAELQINRLPAILIPLPTAAENHQYINAMEQQSKGFARVLRQKDLTSPTLLQAISAVHQDRENYVNAMSQLPPNTAAPDICAHIITYLQKGR